MIVRWPGHIRPGSHCGRLVSTIDIAPTVLKLAGIEPGPSIQGKDFSPLFQDPTAKVRDLIFAERNWHDYASHGRAARSERFKYIRNDDTENPLTPPADAVRSPTFVAMRRLRDDGKLTPAQRSCFVSPRPAEELYDLDADPHELVNLAGDPKFAEVLAGMRRALVGLGAGDGGRPAREADPRRVRSRDGRPPAEPDASPAEDANAETREHQEAMTDPDVLTRRPRPSGPHDHSGGRITARSCSP